MIKSLLRKPVSWLANLQIIQALSLVSLVAIAITLLISPIAIQSDESTIKVGSVSAQDIRAPYSFSFTSETLTDQAIWEAERVVTAIYLPPDPTISREQIQKLQITINYVNIVRLDQNASIEQKLTDLKALANTELSREVAELLLTLSDSRWQSVQDEALLVLEQVMRNPIRDDQISEADRNVSALISYALPQDQARVVAELVISFVVPNRIYSEELTEAARDEARDSVEPVIVSYVSGETIIERGDLINRTTLEALEAYDLLSPENSRDAIIGAISLVIIMTAILPLYLRRSSIDNLHTIRSTLVLTISIIIFLVGARLVIPNRTILPYLFPISAFGLTVASLYGVELGLVLALVLSALSAYGLPISLDLTSYYIFSSLVGLLVLGKGRRISIFFTSGIAIGLAGSAVILAYRLPDATTDLIGLATLIGASFFNGLASASLALLFQYIIAQIIGFPTPLQLLDISRPDHPLLQYMLNHAPGTYQHSLQVANLAERAAEEIGANSLLTRVGAIFHDAGKAMNPSFFIENKPPGLPNPHDKLDPFTSSGIILKHVSDSVQLSRKYRLPARLEDFMKEHHGTFITRYQYSKAVKEAGGQAGEVDMELFRYPGPRPRSRETALLMLADGCEARARADLPPSEEDLRKLVWEQIDFCQREGQLNDTNLTFQDLNLVAETFVRTLRNTHHMRIKYPQLKENKANSKSNQPKSTPGTMP
jgi:cyclic-di-AMP phosphodiesterase PgpH